MPSSRDAARHAPRATVVAVAAFDQISAFHLTVPCAVFETRDSPGLPLFDLRVCAVEPGPLHTSAGFTVQASHGLRDLARADIVIVPSWRDTAEPAPPALLRALQRAHARGALVVGLCLGAFVVAEAGLLDGRSASTHWMWAEDFAARYPRVRLDRDVLYVDEDDVVTSAGTAAGIDCCLHVLRRRWGAEAANGVARRLVVPPHRQGGQAQYVEQPVPASVGADRLAGVLAWLAANLDRAHDLDALAARAAMSRRTFTRHFRQATGGTVGQWLLAQRLALAQRLLETSDAPIEVIAGQAGFGTPLSLRQHFRRVLRVSPSAYRREFRRAA
ncbi:GlxA family transcriptional regulator [Bordetella petrii]|uniref:GlxA family transcriptional regulator n=1 Tax=Bordetella petrii TaxID=94624 RepID=UPI003730C75B